MTLVSCLQARSILLPAQLATGARCLVGLDEERKPDHLVAVSIMERYVIHYTRRNLHSGIATDKSKGRDVCLGGSSGAGLLDSLPQPAAGSEVHSVSRLHASMRLGFLSPIKVLLQSVSRSLFTSKLLQCHHACKEAKSCFGAIVPGST